MVQISCHMWRQKEISENFREPPINTRDRYSEPELGNQYNPSYVDAGENYIYRSVERAIQYGVLLTALLYFFLSPHGLSLASLSESFLFLLTNDADSLVSVSLNSWPS